MEYLETYQLLSECQAGFRKRSSTVTSLLTNTNQWYINMDKGLLNGIIFLDLKKASSNIGTVRPGFLGRRRAAQGRRTLKIQGGASLKIQGGALSLTYVIIICMMSHGRNQEE